MKKMNTNCLLWAAFCVLLIVAGGGCAIFDKPNPYYTSRHRLATEALVASTARSERVDDSRFSLHVKDHLADHRRGQRWEDKEGRASGTALAGNIITIIYECDPATGEPDADALRHEPFHAVQLMKGEYKGHPAWVKKYNPARWHD